MKIIATTTIRLYQLVISPVTTALFGNACRFEPTCSEYSLQAIQKFGLIKGGKLALKRIGKCHPFYKIDSSFDPLPKKA